MHRTVYFRQRPRPLLDEQTPNLIPLSRTRLNRTPLTLSQLQSHESRESPSYRWRGCCYLVVGIPTSRILHGLQQFVVVRCP